jgi:hypothetical protein
MNNASKYSVKIIIVFLFFIIIHQKLQFNVNFSDLIDCSAPVAHRTSNVFVKNLITKNISKMEKNRTINKIDFQIWDRTV